MYLINQSYSFTSEYLWLRQYWIGLASFENNAFQSLMLLMDEFESWIISFANPGGRAVWGVGLLPFAWWDCGFESCRVHGCLSFVNIVCCQVESYATGRSLVQRSPTYCVSLSLIRCCLNPVHLECVGGRVQTKKICIWQMRATCLWYFCNNKKILMCIFNKCSRMITHALLRHDEFRRL